MPPCPARRYVEWSLHEPVPGHYNMTGELNLLNFIQVAEEEGLLVNLRVGPYICAERDMVSGECFRLSRHFRAAATAVAGRENPCFKLGASVCSDCKFNEIGCAAQGGLPPWLLRVKPSIQLRTRDPGEWHKLGWGWGC